MHGIPLDVVLFCEVWCRGHASRCGAVLSEGVSADDWGRSAEGPRRCMGYLWILGGRRAVREERSEDGVRERSEEGAREGGGTMRR